MRRSIADGETAYFHCCNPRGALPELVAVIGLCWPVEECFEAAKPKQQAGLDNYQVRTYGAWHRHITMVMLALAFQTAVARTPQKGVLGGDHGPRTRRLVALTVAEVRRLFNLIGSTPTAVDQGLHWSIW
ncbi:hypothetical protein ABZT02_03095 [Streptomyces sp. NPDC005402]|uniref:hypothetical protein n=1 Tax=Streptomyces sp. NPDC005402 TaxID=3155338 RepID=UPI0033B7B646